MEPPNPCLGLSCLRGASGAAVVPRVGGSRPGLGEGQVGRGLQTLGLWWEEVVWAVVGGRATLGEGPTGFH